MASIFQTSNGAIERLNAGSMAPVRDGIAIEIADESVDGRTQANGLLIMIASLAFPLEAAPGWIFVCVLASALGLPVPAMPTLLMAGALLAGADSIQNALTVAALSLGAAVLAAASGDLVWFIAGRKFGRGILRHLCRLSLSRDTSGRRTESLLEQLGVRVLLVARFVPGLAAVSVPMAGISSVSLACFAIFDLAGVVLWSGASLLTGYFFAPQVEMLLIAAREFGIRAIEIGVVIVAVYVLARYLDRRLLLRRS